MEPSALAYLVLQDFVAHCVKWAGADIDAGIGIQANVQRTVSSPSSAALPLAHRSFPTIAIRNAVPTHQQSGPPFQHMCLLAAQGPVLC